MSDLIGMLLLIAAGIGVIGLVVSIAGRIAAALRRKQ